MGCCDDVRRVAYFYLDGTLGPNKEQFVKSHLVECPDCDQRVGLHKRIRNFLRARLTAHAPDSLRQRILNLCREARPEPTS